MFIATIVFNVIITSIDVLLLFVTAVDNRLPSRCC